MPIRRELRHFYGREWSQVIRPRILERDGHACQRCRVPNHSLIARIDKYPGWWFTLDGEAHDQTGKLRFHFRGSEFDSPDRIVKIRLTIAHLDRIPGHDDDGNLAALCQYCHLNYDRPVNQVQAKETRVTRKDAGRPMLQEGAW